MVDYQLIGKRIGNKRRSFGMTQEELSERVNITTVYLSKIENGRVHPTIDTLNDICDCLDCDLGALFSNVSPIAPDYRCDRVVQLFQACSSSVKPIAVSILEQLSKIVG